jgi:alpha-beta hydrolase superfamily lysophospholipase
MTRQQHIQEHWLPTFDGTELFYRRWPSATGAARGCVVLVHRGHEHSGRMAHLVDEMDLPDFDFVAMDARGHGKSPGARGHSPSLGANERDLQCLVDLITSRHGVPVGDVSVVAQSVGAVVASAWVLDYAPKIRSLVLASPAFKVKLYVPGARSGLALAAKARGNFNVTSYVKSQYLTHDTARQASYDSDPLIAKQISVNILLGLYETAERVVQNAHGIVAPTLLLISGDDWVVESAPQHAFFDALGSSVKEELVLDGFFHDTLGELDRARAIAKARSFILSSFDAPQPLPNLLGSDKAGPSHAQSREVSKKLPATNPMSWYWALGRGAMKVGGLVSDGMKVGVETGFDSGSALDYVYENQPRGKGKLGAAIDKTYLDAIGWRGIRQRKLHVEELIREALSRLDAAGSPARVVDIAAGHGRYVLEALTAGHKLPESILLRDYSPLNVQKGGELILTKGLSGTARFELGDAFDEESLAHISPCPTLGIVSGLYELFPENDAVSRSLSGLSRAIEPGGYLVYTCQPSHPQLEMIARTLTSHRGGAAWVMRLRSQAEMDQLVEKAGFEKVAMRVDEWGIFTVALAIKRA